MSETLLINGEEYPMPHNFTEIIDRAIRPLSDSLNTLNKNLDIVSNEIKSVGDRVDELHLSDTVQDKDLDYIKEKQKAHEARVSALETEVEALKTRTSLMEKDTALKFQQVSFSDQKQKAGKFDTIMKVVVGVLTTIIASALVALVLQK